jgi:hypothetical protein
MEIKLCECGCGEPSPLSHETRKSLGLVRGQPRRFVKGHDKFIDLTGQRFGKLIVVKRESSHPITHASNFLCKCDCGNLNIIRANSLSMGNTKSCGCYREGFRKTHGKSYSYLYRCWAHMIERCDKILHKSYKNYGGRGISVCAQWYSFEKFAEDMGERPTPKHSIDRIDNNGNYEPGNCKWSTKSEQNLNKRKMLPGEI